MGVLVARASISDNACHHGSFPDQFLSRGSSRAKSKTKIVDGHAHNTMKANHRLLAVGMRKSPGTLCDSEAQIILWILLSVINDVAVVAE